MIYPIQRLFLILCLLSFTLVIILSGCSKNKTQNREDEGELLLSPPEVQERIVENTEGKVLETLDLDQKNEILANGFGFKYPDFTAVIETTQSEHTADVIEKNGGKVLYPEKKSLQKRTNLIVATLPSELLLEDSFIQDLKVHSINLGFNDSNKIKINSTEPIPSAVLENSFVPVEDTGLQNLRNNPGGLASGPFNGKGIKIAIIDTGVDPSHSFFQDRVIYWEDSTQETDAEVFPIKLNKKKGTFELNGKDITLPSQLDLSQPLFYSIVSEAKMQSQLKDDSKMNPKKRGIDINENSFIKDEFLVVLGQLNTESLPHAEFEKKYFAFIDLNGNKEFDEKEQRLPIADFNLSRFLQKNLNIPLEGFLEYIVFSENFPVLKRPLNIFLNEKGVPQKIAIGVQGGYHGTFVAGIAAGQSEGVMGAAPEAEILSLKVCAESGCPVPALIRGILSAFNNPYGYTPDIVNLSLGSLQDYTSHILNTLIRDLSSRTGAVFIVSASNDGPGHRTINGIGSFGPAILTGASVSSAFLNQHYGIALKSNAPNAQWVFPFSSVGPSFTGELRPNIIAPGSAFSSSSIREDGLMVMNNGTSMSSPMLSGVLASIFSGLKEEAFTPFLDFLDLKNENLNPTNDSEKSLLHFAEFIKIATEEGSVRLDKHSVLDQGFGLIQAPLIYEKIKKLFKSQKNSDLIEYPEIIINDNKDSNRLYHREEDKVSQKTIKLGLFKDVRYSEEQWLDLGKTKFTVKLEEVEIRNPDGKIDILNPSDSHNPFQIYHSSHFKKDLFLLNRRRNTFLSLRDLNKMKEGYTYTALYSVYFKGNRIKSLVDVVHMPYYFSAESKKVDRPLLISQPTQKTHTLLFTDQNLKPFEYIKIPVWVSDHDQALKLSLAFSSFEESGIAVIYIFDPDGKLVNYNDPKNIIQIDGLSGKKTKLEYLLKNLNKKGIYEVVLGLEPRSHVNEVSVDLMIESLRFGIESKSVSLRTKNTPVFENLMDQEFFSVENNLWQITEIRSLRFIQSAFLKVINRVQVAPHKTTFRKLEIPDIHAESVLSQKRELHVQFSLQHKDDFEDYSGRIDHRLFIKNENGDFEVYAEASSEQSRQWKKVFLNLDLKEVQSKDIYFAIETLSSFSAENGVKSRIKGMGIEVLVPDNNIENLTELKARVMNQSKNSFIIGIDAPSEFPQCAVMKDGFPVPQIRTYLEVITNNDEAFFRVPVTVYQ